MAIYEQIMAIYPQLTYADFGPSGTITICNDLDGKGDYIKYWNNQNPKPTEEELKATGK